MIRGTKDEILRQLNITEVFNSEDDWLKYKVGSYKQMPVALISEQLDYIANVASHDVITAIQGSLIGRLYPNCDFIAYHWECNPRILVDDNGRSSVFFFRIIEPFTMHGEKMNFVMDWTNIELI